MKQDNILDLNHITAAAIDSFIKDNLNSHSLLTDISNHFAVSTQQFRAIFYQHFGIPLNKYFDILKIEKGKEYLRRGEKVVDFASKLGYRDQNFITFFTKRVGVTPLVWKARNNPKYIANKSKKKYGECLIGPKEEHLKKEIEKLIPICINKSGSSKMIAGKLGISNYIFHSLFKQLFGVLFSDYLIAARIEAGKECLRKGELIKDVSATIGCDGYATFGQMFTKITGLTPSQWVQRYIKANPETSRDEHNAKQMELEGRLHQRPPELRE